MYTLYNHSRTYDEEIGGNLSPRFVTATNQGIDKRFVN
jgi:hypothetical protein